MFKIGEFSQIAQVSDNLLRHYDSIDLLKPIHVDEWTGYRYYSASQLPQLNRILALKDLGLSLEEARQVLADNIKPSEIRHILSNQKAAIEEMIRSEKMRLHRVEARLQEIEAEGSLENLEIIIKHVPSQPFLAMDYRIFLLDEAPDFVRKVSQHVETAIGKKPIKHFAIIFNYDGFRTENVDVEAGMVLAEPKEIQIPFSATTSLTLRKLPEEKQVVTLVHHEKNHILFNVFGALGRWLERNDYQLSGAVRKLYLTPPDPKEEDKALVEIQFPIQPTIKSFPYKG
ncbi:MAG: MerR family transcriptional regulator [Chloroflexota bacterium]